MGAKTNSGADCETDHILLGATMRVKPTCTKMKEENRQTECEVAE